MTTIVRLKYLTRAVYVVGGLTLFIIGCILLQFYFQ